MKPKRQIIKTRPQQPYIIARIIIAILAAVIAAVMAWHYYHQTVRAGNTARVHVLLARARFTGVAGSLKEGYVAARMPPIRAA